MKKPASLHSTLLLLFGLCALPSLAAETEKHFLSFEDAVRVALEENPSLRSIRAQGESLKQRAKQSLAPSNPVVTFTKNNTPVLNPSSRAASDSFGITWTLGFPGKAFIQSESLESQANSIREQSADRELDVISSLAVNFVALHVSERKMKLLRQTQEESRSLIKLIEQKYRMAQASQVDLLNAKAALSSIEHDLIVQEGEHEGLITQFRNLIKKPDSLAYEPLIPKDIRIPEIKPGAEELEQLLMENSHRIQSARQQVNASRASLNSARMAALPDLQLGAAVNVYNEPSAAPITGLNRDYVMSIGISLPIFFPFNELSGIHSANQDLDSNEFQLQATSLQAVADLRSALTAFRALGMQAESLKTYVIPMNQASYDLSLKAYSLGKSDYLRLKDARETLFESTRTYLNVLLDQSKNYQQLLQLVGCDFNGESKFYACARKKHSS